METLHRGVTEGDKCNISPRAGLPFLDQHRLVLDPLLRTNIYEINTSHAGIIHKNPRPSERSKRKVHTHHDLGVDTHNTWRRRGEGVYFDTGTVLLLAYFAGSK